MDQTVENNRFKIVLYCHNRDGLGHIVRSVRIAEQLVETGVFAPVILTGCRALDSIAVPNGVDVHRITPLPVDLYASGAYRILTERIQQMRDFIKSFKPDVLLIDTLPLGYKKELKEVLTYAAENSGDPLCVLGLPYPSDELRNALKNTNDQVAFSALKFGLNYANNDEELYDALPFPVKKTGIVAGPLPPPANPASQIILALVGGGGVSADLPEILVEATRSVREKGFVVRFVVGPLSEMSEMTARVGDAENFELVAAVTVEKALADAKLVIGRCGYNSAATLVRSTLPIIFVPFCKTTSDEQYTRAQELSGLKNIRMVDPLEGDIPGRLENAINELICCLPEERDIGDAFSGAQNAAKILAELVIQNKKITPFQ